MKASHESSTTPAILFEKVPYLRGYEYLDTILAAISDQRCLEISYQTFDHDEPYTITLHPYFVKEFHNRWYVVGLVDSKSELRTFALDRIQSISPCGTNYIQNIDTDPEDYFKDCIGINFMERDIETVRLSFTPYQGKYVKTQHLHRSQVITQDDSEGVVVELHIIINHELKMLILSFGDQVKVLGPVTLATDIAKISQRVAKSYRSNPQKS
jgi:predicted DNA-binding transcriptional regulator YafY